MARGFRPADSPGVSSSGLPVSSYPIAIGAFYKFSVAGTSGNQETIACYSDAGDANGGVRLMAYGTGVGSGFGARSSSGGSDRDAKFSQTVDSTNWRWVLGVWRTDSDRSVYVTNIGSLDIANNTVGPVTPTLSTFDIGRWYANSTASNFAAGQIACVTVWDYAFTDAEVSDHWLGGTKSLSGFIHPSLVKPDHIKFLWGANRVSSASAANADSWDSGISLTMVNAPTFAEHPPIAVRKRCL